MHTMIDRTGRPHDPWRNGMVQEQFRSGDHVAVELRRHGVPHVHSGDVYTCDTSVVHTMRPSRHRAQEGSRWLYRDGGSRGVHELRRTGGA